MDTRLLVATNEVEMKAARSNLLDFFKGKVLEATHEWKEVKDALEVAERNKWGTSALRGQVARCKGRRVFYEKARAAVEAGYALIPDFPIDLFAVRTKKPEPTANITESNWNRDALEKAQQLPSGEGRYVSDETVRQIHSVDEKVDAKGNKIQTHWYENVAFKDVVFPAIAVKPEVMEAAANAMALRIFDEVGICPQSSRKDPMIIGRIKHRVGYHERTLNFLICWFIDLKQL